MIASSTYNEPYAAQTNLIQFEKPCYFHCFSREKQLHGRSGGLICTTQTIFAPDGDSNFAGFLDLFFLSIAFCGYEELRSPATVFRNVKHEVSASVRFWGCLLRYRFAHGLDMYQSNSWKDFKMASGDKHWSSAVLLPGQICSQFTARAVWMHAPVVASEKWWKMAVILANLGLFRGSFRPSKILVKLGTVFFWSITAVTRWLKRLYNADRSVSERENRPDEL